MDTLIVFKIAEEEVGLDITKVREVTEIEGLVPVPKAPDYLVGLVNVRGEVIPVISLRRRFGLIEEEKSKVILVVEDQNRVIGLKLDALIGTKRIEEKNINKNSEILSTKKEKDFFCGIYETETKPILILDLNKILVKEE